MLIFGTKLKAAWLLVLGTQENELVNATITVMKLVVGSCSKESQCKIIQKSLKNLAIYFHHTPLFQQYSSVERVAVYSRFRMFFL